MKPNKLPETLYVAGCEILKAVNISLKGCGAV
jgi:hypothetical protein